MGNEGMGSGEMRGVKARKMIRNEGERSRGSERK